MADFTPIREQVARQTTVFAGVRTLLQDLSARLVDAADDPAEVNAIAAEMRTQIDALASDVTANTPAAGETQPNPAGPTA